MRKKLLIEIYSYIIENINSWIEFILSTSTGVNLDASKEWQVGYQEEATPIMSGLRDFHDKLVYYIIMIMMLIVYIVIKEVKTGRKILIKYLSSFISWQGCRYCRVFFRWVYATCTRLGHPL